MSKDLVKRLRYLALDTDAYESRTMSEAADRIAALEMAMEDAVILARELAVDLAATHYPEVPQFKPFESLTGLLSQIDNMTSGLVRNPVDADLEAALNKCVNIVETYRIPVGNSAAGEMACEWTYDALKQIRDDMKNIISAALAGEKKDD